MATITGIYDQAWFTYIDYTPDGFLIGHPLTVFPERHISGGFEFESQPSEYFPAGYGYGHSG